MNQTILLESKTARNGAIQEVTNERMDDVFHKVKGLVLLPDNTHVTVEMVANYYEVGLEAINSLIKDNRDELIGDGIKVLEGEQLKSFKNISQISNRAKALTIIPRRAILRIGMLLRDSEIAKQIREQISLKYPELYVEIIKSRTLQIKKYEKDIKTYLEFSFGKDNLQYQVKCDIYIIDFVLFGNIAIEVDEHGHNSYNKEKEKVRTNIILNSGYKLIRFNPHKQKPYELIIEINKLLE